MKPATRDLLRQGAKFALSAGAFTLLTRLSTRIPGPLGKLARGAITVGTLVVPMLRKRTH
ncbi:hypothetical protein FEM03_01315 [Phragmitibacter flavus]|uniref:Uncharacterized protein n=1 Tax=Phragmitibacter flavus TaxID=2576071 RepID=A0A5R8KKJ4_9BACT|nr:hypothetical protein [Phragmitibacter flavus]TLD72741.1 hypothetical protein FEM03_01315 [Phragmitibacter flavus]